MANILIKLLHLCVHDDVIEVTNCVEVGKGEGILQGKKTHE